MSRDLLLVVASLFAWGLGEGMFMYFQPLYLQQWGAQPVVIGAILGGMGIAMAVCQAPAGYLGDRIGRRPVMWASWILGALSAWIMALATSLPGFVVGLLLYGLTSFAMAPMNSYITGARGKWSVARALTTASAAYQIGAVIGPLIGGNLGQRFGLKTVYMISASIFIISVAIVLLTSSQPVHSEAKEAQKGHLIQNRRFMGFLVMMFVTMVATYLPQPLTPNFLQDIRGLPLMAIGELGSIGSLGNAILALGLGRIQPGLAFLVGQVAVGVFSLLLWKGSGMAWYAIGYFFFGGYRVCRLMAMALTRPLVRRSEIGLAYGVLETVNCVSVILAPLLAGYLFSFNPAWMYSFSLALLALSLGFSAWYLFASKHAPGRVREMPEVEEPEAELQTVELAAADE